jgi:hypothetical protein
MSSARRLITLDLNKLFAGDAHLSDLLDNQTVHAALVEYPEGVRLRFIHPDLAVTSYILRLDQSQPLTQLTGTKQ